MKETKKWMKPKKQTKKIMMSSCSLLLIGLIVVVHSTPDPLCKQLLVRLGWGAGSSALFWSPVDAIPHHCCCHLGALQGWWQVLVIIVREKHLMIPPASNGLWGWMWSAWCWCWPHCYWCHCCCHVTTPPICTPLAEGACGGSGRCGDGGGCSSLSVSWHVS